MKKLLVVLLGVLMVFGLVGCGSKQEATTGDNADSTPVAIKIGGSGPLTGGAAIYGNAVKVGAEIAVEEINAAAGYEVFDISLFQDDAHDTEQATTAFAKMVDDGMQVSLLCVTSAPCNAAAPLYADNQIFAITPSGSNADIVTYGDNLFQMCFTDPNQGVASADYFKEHFADKVVGVMYQSSTDYSKGIFQKFVANFSVDDDKVTSFADETDYSVQVKQLKDAGVEVVFSPIYYNEAALILAEAEKQDFHPVWFGVDGFDGILGVENFDTNLAEGLYLLTPFSADSTDSKVANFVAAYKAKTGEVPNQFAADAYDCVYAIYQAVQAAGLDGSMDAATLCEALVGQFTTMTFNGTTGTNVTWAASGEVSKAPMAVVIENGAYVLAD